MENKKALVVIDLQNDITKNYKDIISNVNTAIDWAKAEGMQIVYIQHHNKIPFIRAFIAGTKGADFVPELKILSDNIFVKENGNALTSKDFAAFIKDKDLNEFYVAGADATACVKATCVNMKKSAYAVNVIYDCVTSYNLKKLDKMFSYYKKKGCEVKSLNDCMVGEK